MRELKPPLVEGTLSDPRRTPHGVRELKLIMIVDGDYLLRRTPHGVRELKPTYCFTVRLASESHPTWGA